MLQRLKSIKEILIKSHFLRNIIALSGGTAAAQFIPLLALPFLSRIYSPESYGILALFTGLVLMLVPLFSLEYSQAILYAKSKKDALHLLFGAHFVGAVLFLVIFLLGLTYRFSQFYSDNYKIFLLIPFSAYLQSLIVLFISFFNRCKKFSLVSISKVYNAITNLALSFGLALLAYLEDGLVMAYFCAQVLTIIFFIVSFYKEGYRLSYSRIFRVNFSILKDYKEYPKLILPSAFINVLINHIPSYILGYYYSTATVGYFNRSRQVLSVPISQIANSIGDVFKQEANQRYVNGQSNKRLYLKTAQWLITLSVPFLIIILVFGPELFTLAFGSEWILSGEYSQILIFLFVLRFINTPLGSMYYITEKYSEALLMNVVLLTLISFFLFISSAQDSKIETVIFYYTIGYSISYIIGLIRTYQFSCKKPLKKELVI